MSAGLGQTHQAQRDERPRLTRREGFAADKAVGWLRGLRCGRGASSGGSFVKDVERHNALEDLAIPAKKGPPPARDDSEGYDSDGEDRDCESAAGMGPRRSSELGERGRAALETLFEEDEMDGEAAAEAAALGLAHPGPAVRAWMVARAAARAGAGAARAARAVDALLLPAV